MNMSLNEGILSDMSLKRCKYSKLTKIIVALYRFSFFGMSIHTIKQI